MKRGSRTRGVDLPSVCALLSKCMNCGKMGPHFIPPCFGDPGMYICERKGQTAEVVEIVVEEANTEVSA